MRSDGGAWGRENVLGEWRKCLGSQGGEGGVKEVLWGEARCWGREVSAWGVEEVRGEVRRCLGGGKVLGE